MAIRPIARPSLASENGMHCNERSTIVVGIR